MGLRLRLHLFKLPLNFESQINLFEQSFHFVSEGSTRFKIVIVGFKSQALAMQDDEEFLSIVALFEDPFALESVRPSSCVDDLSNCLLIHLAFLECFDVLHHGNQLGGVLLRPLFAWLCQSSQLRLHSDWQILESTN